jgi:hypothetical protein
LWNLGKAIKFQLRSPQDTSFIFSFQVKLVVSQGKKFLKVSKFNVEIHSQVVLASNVK